MSKSLAEITDAWGHWKAGQFGTSLKWTESTQYDHQGDLNRSDYLVHEVGVSKLDTTYGENKGDLIYTTGMEEWYDNDTSASQSDTFKYSETQQCSFTWSTTETLKLGAKAEASVGIPDIGDTKITLTTEFDLSSTQTETRSDSKTWENDTPVVVLPKKSLHCQTVMTVQKYDVSFKSHVLLSGSVAIWFVNKVDYDGRNDWHWLWFIPIGTVLSEARDNHVIDTSGYEPSGANAIASVNGVLQGNFGLDITVKSKDCWLRDWKPTPAELQQVLMGELSNPVKDKLKEYPSSSGDSNSLTANMRTLADAAFAQDLGHQCSANYRPADCLGLPHVVDVYTIINTEDDLDQQITNFIQDTLLSAANLPSWLQATCKADITTSFKTLLSKQGLADEVYYCDVTPCNGSYTAMRDDEVSMGCESMIVCVSGELEVGVDVTVRALYFLGVFYPTSSPVDAAIGQLRDQAYTSASASTSVSAIVDDASLEDALEQYATTQFKGKYLYPYKETPVDFPDGDPNDYLLSRNTHLQWFQGGDASQVDEYVKDKIFGGLDIPIKEAQDAALTEVTAMFRGIFDDTQKGVWSTQYLGTTLLQGINNLNPVSIDAVIMAWSQDKATVSEDNGEDVQVNAVLTYTYFMGVVHECKPDSLKETLFKKFCDGIPGNTNDDLTGNPTILQEELKPYTRDGWMKAFNYDFDGTDGPPDRVPGTGIKSFDLLFDWEHIPTVEEIQSAIDHKWYRRDDKRTIPHCGAQIYDDVVDQISYRAGPDYVKVDFDWQQDSFVSYYYYTGKDGGQVTVKENALYTFAYGHVSGERHGGINREVFAMSFLVNVYITPTKESDDWD